MASSASTPPVTSTRANGLRAAISAQGTMIWSSFVARRSIEAAKTTRPMPDQTIALMHIGQGSPVV